MEFSNLTNQQSQKGGIMTQNQFYMAQIGAKREQWQAELAEAERSHRAQESLSTLQLNESIRHNTAMEREQTRSNLMNEYFNQQRNAETYRTNKSYEDIERSKAAESVRHNRSAEGISKFTAMSNDIIGNMNANTGKMNANTARATQRSQSFKTKQDIQRDIEAGVRDETRTYWDAQEAKWRNRERWSNIINTTIRTASGTVKDVMGVGGNLIKLFG
jgi:hypothetical protein